MSEQFYEDYWSITNAYTNYNGDGFLSCLAVCVEFIDLNKSTIYSEEKYLKLQVLLRKTLGITEVSVRKAINQLVKLGFINSHLVSYNFDSIEYLNAKTNKKRQSLLSKIVYTNSSFNRSVVNASKLHQMNFLIKTLIENGKLSKSEIIALMLVDITKFTKGFLTKEQLGVFEKQAIESGFVKRKYNQVGYLFNLLEKLDNIVFFKEELYFVEDAKRIFGDDLDEGKTIRDPYLHRIYKNQLQEESIFHLSETKCMVEGLAYPVLIASHIKPFVMCDLTEAYDVNNGILLSRNIDSLFDLGYLTFDNIGGIIFSKDLDGGVKKFVSGYSLDAVFLNPHREIYFDYHRKNVFEKRYKKP